MKGKPFQIKTDFHLIRDQKESVEFLTKNFKNKKYQLLWGITGTGKTFTVANVIKNVNRKTLVLAHNKTLAGQLYSEFKLLFPNNRVEYFVSNFDYYQPEAYVASKDLYIDKTTKHNDYLDMLRNRTLNSLLTRDDVIVVASVAAIYASYDPKIHKSMLLTLSVGDRYTIKELAKELVKLQYKRTRIVNKKGNFKVLGNSIMLNITYYENTTIIFQILNNKIMSIAIANTDNLGTKKNVNEVTISPNEGYLYSNNYLAQAIIKIKEELKERLEYFDSNNLFVEKQRLEKRVENDISDLKEFGYCSGIENYSAQLELREPFSQPNTLIDYFGDDWLLIVDESHITLDQVNGMYKTDRNRKKSLVKYGFRLPSALDNRPLSYKEFIKKIKRCIFVTATPKQKEFDFVNHNYIKQIIRPTYLLDPKVSIYPKENQVLELIRILKEKIKNKEKTIILTLTKKFAEELSIHLEKYKIKAEYLHSELKTLERAFVLNKLRKNVIDVIVGINLLREGIDLPEVSTIMILDADVEGFLRDKNSLLQMFGRVSRNINGNVILFADKITKSIKEAMTITKNNREYQIEYNKKNNIVPIQIVKDIIDVIDEKNLKFLTSKQKLSKMKKKQKEKYLKKIKKDMLLAAKNLDFEQAAFLRNILIEYGTIS